MLLAKIHEMNADEPTRNDAFASLASSAMPPRKKSFASSVTGVRPQRTRK